MFTRLLSPSTHLLADTVRPNADRTHEQHALRKDGTAGEPTAAATTAPYGVMATIRLQRKDMARFFKLAHGFRDEFKKGGLILTMSGWDVLQEDAREPGPMDRRALPGLKPREVELFSIWHLANNDANSLRSAMSYLFDVIAYYSFNSLQLEEQKVLGLRFATGVKPPPSLATRDPNQRYVYVRTTNFLKTNQLAELRARYRSSIWSFCRATGWFLGDAYLGLTGTPNTVTQVWLVPEGSYARFNSQLARAPWDALLETPPEYRVLQPANFDPNLGDST